MIEVVSDASVVLKWFHADGEEEVPEARALVTAHRPRALTLLGALNDICAAVRPDADEWRTAADRWRDP